MPKVTFTSMQKAGTEIVKLIWGELESRDMQVSELAERTGISMSILYSRKKRPEKFTVGELRIIGRNLGIPIDKLRAAIGY